MQNSALKNNKNLHRLLFWLILAAGIFARVWRFGAVPGGINQDEAFAAYEAWSIMKYGVDTAGYHNPVYLTAWGSGMNALESYLMMPFIALFGLEEWAIRMPQMIVSCLSIWVLYLLVRRTVGEEAGLWAMFMLAIAPWHIIAGRWGLESNLTPGFLLFGLWFFVLALEKPRFLMLSALMYGLALYCYATYWIYIPFIILAMVIYAMAHKKLRFDRYMVISVLILALLALPLLLFLAVNNGLINEIRLPFMSIPKLLYMRSGEISFDEKALKLELVKNIFVLQNDKNIWNSPERYGLFYYISAPFAVIGLVLAIKRIVRSFRVRRFCPEFLLLCQLVLALPQLILVKINATKINILFIPLTILIALGIHAVGSLGKKRFGALLAAAYAVLFIGFECYYFTDYADKCAYHFSSGLEEALDVAMEEGEHVYLEEGMFYPKILFYAQTPVEDFRETVQYLFYPAPYLTAVEFDRFSFWMNPYQPDETGAYVMSIGADRGLLAQQGYTVETYGHYQVAYK